MSAHEIVKAGWLFRLSSFLKKWKKNWVVLYHDGYLRYFENENKTVAEDAISLPAECRSIKTGPQKDVKAPGGMDRDHMFAVVCNNKTWQFCGESLDDMRAWQIMLEQARVLYNEPSRNHSSQPPPYSPYAAQCVSTYYDNSSVTRVPQQIGYPHQGLPYNSYQYVGQNGQPYVIRSADGHQTTIIYPDNRDRYSGSNMALGMMTGAALGTMMWGPLLWW